MTARAFKGRLGKLRECLDAIERDMRTAKERLLEVEAIIETQTNYWKGRGKAA